MKHIRWFISTAVLGLVTVAFMYNVHKKHFNLFVIGFLALIFLSIVLFWATCRREGSEKEDEAPRR